MATIPAFVDDHEQDMPRHHMESWRSDAEGHGLFPNRRRTQVTQHSSETLDPRHAFRLNVTTIWKPSNAWTPGRMTRASASVRR